MEADTTGAVSQTSDNATKLTSDALIQTELKGKFFAVERYDSMLWKIRSGYILVLYGALSLLGANGLNMPVTASNLRSLLAVLLLVWGFSIGAALIDLGFLLAKLRVVADTNALYELAVDLVTGHTILVPGDPKLKELLHISGESIKPVKPVLFWNAMRWVLPLYLITPLFGTIIYSILTG